MTLSQIQILQRMTGEERLEQAFKLSDFARELAVLNIKKTLGEKATPAKIRQKLWQRLHPDFPLKKLKEKNCSKRPLS